MHLKILLSAVIMLLFFTSQAYSGFLDDLFNRITSGSQAGPSEATIVSALKEALSIGTRNAVTSVSKPDGYFANKNIKIPMPEKLQTMAGILENLGFRQQVDDFVLSMNRAAERAAPKAASCLVDAITQMSFEDAKKILDGGDTAATDYFRAKTSDKIYAAFKPIIGSAMDEVGVTRYYRQIVQQYETIPFMKAQALDLDAYVTSSALDGLFYMVAQEEKKIRTDPAARVTDLLKTVFGKSAT